MKLFNELYFDLATGLTMQQAARVAGCEVMVDDAEICGACGESPTDCTCVDTIKCEFSLRGFEWCARGHMFASDLYDVVPTLPLRWGSSVVVYRRERPDGRDWQNTNYDSVGSFFDWWGDR